MSILTVGIRKLRRVQLGRETTTAPGTQVDTTTYWRGPANGIEDQRAFNEVDEDVGVLTGLDRTYNASILGAIAFDASPLTVDQSPYIFNASMEVGSASADGSGSGQIWAYNMPSTTQLAINTYTIEAGDNIQAESLTHSFVNDFTISGTGQEALMIAANWMGQQVANDSFTTTAAIPTEPETIVFNKGKLYIDPTTIGTTQVTATLLSMEFNYTSGWTPIFTADGNLYFTGIKNIGPTAELTLTMEHNATSVTEKTAWRNQTRRLVRLIWEGSALNTAGTTYTYKTFILDVKGKYTNVDVLGEENGNNVLSFTLMGRANSLTTNGCDITVVNEKATLD